MKKLMLFLLSVVGFVLSSCDHKTLEAWPEQAPTKAYVRVDVDWSQFTEDDDLTGMTVRAYNQATGQVTQVLTNTTDHANLALEPGLYTILVFNQTVDEYASLAFSGLDDITTAAICATKGETRWYTRGDDEMVAQEPAWFARAIQSDVEITKEMLEKSPYQTKTKTKTKTKTRQANEEAAITIGTLVPRNIIHSLNIVIDVENFKFLRSVRGSISHMAGCMSLQTLKRGSSKVTMLLEKWNLRATKTQTTTGQVYTSTRCFGLPADRTGVPEDNILYLELLLADGSTVLKYELPVGQMMWEGTDPDEPLHISIEVPLPEPLPDIDIAGSGMGVNVGEWKEIHADIPL